MKHLPFSLKVLELSQSCLFSLSPLSFSRDLITIITTLFPKVRGVVLEDMPLNIFVENHQFIAPGNGDASEVF